MASGTISGSYRGYTLRSVWSSTINVAGNYSDVTITHYLDCASSYALYIGTRTNTCTCGEAKSFTSPNISTGGGTTITLGTTTHRVNHDSDGTKQVTLTTNFNIQAYISDVWVETITASGTITLDNIPRYANVITWNVASKTETSITLNWKTSETCSAIRYGTSTSSYTTTNVNTNSGQVTITGLNANQNYTLYFMPKRKDSSLWGDGGDNVWKNTTQKTEQYPYVSAIGTNELTIGNSQTLTLHNPFGRTVTVYMKKNNTSGTQLYSGTTSGTTITFTPTSSTLYNSIPNDASANCVYYCTYSNHTVSTKSGTYKIRGDELPTFNANNWSYTADKTSLTNNNQTIINKYSVITINIGTAATSSYGATISKYIIKWGNATNNTTTTSGTITNGNGQTLIVTAVDSRNLSRETSKTIANANYVNYTDLNINEISTDRNNGIETGVKLNLSGSIFNGNFGNNGVANALSYAKYYVSTDGTNWSSAYPSDNSMLNAIVKSGGLFTLSDFVIHANGSSGGFTAGTQYYVKVQIKDASNLLSTTVVTSIVPDGKVARTVYQDSNGNYHEGINGLPDDSYIQKVYGNSRTTGNHIVDGVISAGSYGIFPAGIRGKTLDGGGGTNGYMYAFDLTTSGTYQNQYITFDVLQRSRKGKVSICLSSSGTAGTVAVSTIKKIGNIAVYYIVQNNTLKLYIQKSEAYDNIEIAGLFRGSYMNNTTITWKNQTVTSLPSGYTTVGSDYDYELSHASTGTGYGAGTTSNYGHCKLANNLTTSSYADGEALAANQGKVLKDLIDTLTPVTLYDNTTGKKTGEYITISNITNYKRLQITFTAYYGSTTNTGGCSNICWLDLTRNHDNLCRAGLAVPYYSGSPSSATSGSAYGNAFYGVFEANISNGRLYCVIGINNEVIVNTNYVMTKVVGYKY